MLYEFDRRSISCRAAYLGYEPEDKLGIMGAQMRFGSAPCIAKALSRMGADRNYDLMCSPPQEYLDACADWLQRERNWSIDPETLVPAAGIHQGLAAAIYAFTQPGDGIILSAPYWSGIYNLILNTSRKPVVNPLIYTGDHYEMDFEDLEERMSDPRNTMYFLCNPHNPIMDVWEEEDLRRIARLAKEHHIMTAVDEIFAEQMFGAAVCFPYASIEEAQDLCISFFSLGKAFNFTGVCHASAAVPDEDNRERFRKACRALGYDGRLSPFMYTAVMAGYTKEGADWIAASLDYMAENERIMTQFFSKELPQVHICRHRAGSLLWIDWNGLGLTPDDFRIFIEKDAGIPAEFADVNGEKGCFLRWEIGFPREEILEQLEQVRQAAVRRGFAAKGAAVLQEKN